MKNSKRLLVWMEAEATVNQAEIEELVFSMNFPSRPPRILAYDVPKKYYDVHE